MELMRTAIDPAPWVVTAAAAGGVLALAGAVWLSLRATKRRDQAAMRRALESAARRAPPGVPRRDEAEDGRA